MQSAFDVMADGEAHQPDSATLSLLNPLIFPLVPLKVRVPITVLWRANARLAQMARAGKERALRQIKLRWWADQLTDLAVGEDHPDPLLTSVAHHLLLHVESKLLADLTEAWMVSIDAGAGDGNDVGTQLFTITGQLLGCDAASLTVAGRAWAGVEQRLAAGVDGGWADAQAQFQHARIHELPRALAALTGLARRIAVANGRRAPGREQWTIFKIGLVGR
ncbi:MAG: hypothetical protein ABL874_02405 [Sphingopyxis sp.]